MVYLILLGLTFFVQLFAASWYDLAKKTGNDKRAFKHKMMCSAVYITDILLCTLIGAGFSDTYALLFLVAFTVLFASDIIERKSSLPLNTVFAVLRFSGYFILAVALAVKNRALFGGATASIKVNVAIMFICTVAFAVLCILKKQRLSSFVASVYLLLNAISVGIPLQQSGDAKMQAASCAVIIGAVALAVSSVVFAFDKQDKKSLLRINSYYFGLMFISCSVAVL